jgi:hypothetical protein
MPPTAKGELLVVYSKCYPSQSSHPPYLPLRHQSFSLLVIPTAGRNLWAVLEDSLPPVGLLLAKAKGPDLLFYSYFPLAVPTDPSFLGMTS